MIDRMSWWRTEELYVLRCTRYLEQEALTAKPSPRMFTLALHDDPYEFCMKKVPGPCHTVRSDQIQRSNEAQHIVRTTLRLMEAFAF